MSKFTKGVKSFFLKCYSNAEDAGVVGAVEKIAITGVKVGVDILDATVINMPKPVEDLTKKGLTIGVETAFKKLDNFMDSEEAKMDAVTKIVSESPLGGDSVADNTSIPSLSVMGNVSEIAVG
jgi:hypothetical protein